VLLLLVKRRGRIYLEVSGVSIRGDVVVPKAPKPYRGH
jgi:hypothetical protein